MGRRGETFSKKGAIIQLLKEEPDLTPNEVAKRLDTTKWYVYQVMRRNSLDSSPMNRRVCRLEARLKSIEESMYKLLSAKGLIERKSEFGL